jgi:hypothetical protein
MLHRSQIHESHKFVLVWDTYRPRKHWRPSSCHKILQETKICNVLSSGVIFAAMLNCRTTCWNLIISAFSQNCFFLYFFLTSLIPSTLIPVKVIFFQYTECPVYRVPEQGRFIESDGTLRAAGNTLQISGYR